MEQTTLTFFKSWSEICKIEDQVFKLAVTAIDEPEILKGLKRGFPNLFTTEKPKYPRIPRSILFEWYEETYKVGQAIVAEKGNDEFYGPNEQGARSKTCEELSLPYVTLTNEPDWVSPGYLDFVPNDIREATEDQYLDGPNPKEFIWKGVPHFIFIGPASSKPENWDYVIIPACCVDITA